MRKKNEWREKRVKLTTVICIVTAADKRIRNQFETAAMLPLERHKQLCRGQNGQKNYSVLFSFVSSLVIMETFSLSLR
jgi:hypothetical protein